MIRIKGSLAEVAMVEDIIKQGTVWVKMPFIAMLKHDGGVNGENQGNGFESKRRSRTYGIVGDVSKVKDTDITWLRNFVLWWMNSEVTIRFVYDERTGEACIVVDKESWYRIQRIMPRMKDIVAPVRRNHGVIVLGGECV